MRKVIVPVVGAVLLSAAGVLATAGPAMAEPCGAGSYVTGTTLHVGYRNCGGSTTARYAIVSGNDYPCFLIRAGASQELIALPGGAGKNWSVGVC